MSDSIHDSKAFVLEQAKRNIEAVSQNPGYVEQAKQVNASLASIVAMERNAVMFEAIQLQRVKADALQMPGLPE